MGRHGLWALCVCGALGVGCVGALSGGGGGGDDGGGGRDGGGGGDAGDVPPIPNVEAWTPRPCGGIVKCVGSGDSIADAVGAAVDGDVIQVAAGTYAGEVAVSGIALTLIGGLSSDFGTWDPSANPTFVDAGSGSGFSFSAADGSWLQGFVVRGGGGTCDGDCNGGGVYAREGSYTIAGNVLENGDVGEGGQGGGIYLRGSGMIVGNVVRNNRAGRGAGLSVNAEGGQVVISRNIVEGNRGLSDHGGGMYLTGDLVVSDNMVRDNHTGVNVGYGWGGGVIIYGGGARARTYLNVFTNNYAPLQGSGLFVDDEAIVTSENDLFYANDCNRDGGVAIYVDGLSSGSQLTVINATIAGNDCPGNDLHSAIYVEKASSLTLRNTIMWQNGTQFFVDGSSTLAVSYSQLEDAEPGDGNSTGDPLFANAAAGDFHLRSTAGRFDPASSAFVEDAVTSPALDRGAPGDPYDQEPTPNGGRRNLGHTGNTPEASISP